MLKAGQVPGVAAADIEHIDELGPMAQAIPEPQLLVLSYNSNPDIRTPEETMQAIRRRLEQKIRSAPNCDNAIIFKSSLQFPKA